MKYDGRRRTCSAVDNAMMRTQSEFEDFGNGPRDNALPDHPGN